MADIAQPGLVKQFVDEGALKPITYARNVLLANFSPAWIALGTFNKKIYGLVFKASNKSTVWYNVPAFKNAGVKPPTTWPQLARRPARSRPPACRRTRSAARTAGRSPTCSRTSTSARQARRSTRCSTAHKIKWTDPSVTAALKTMAQVVGTSANMAGGTSGAVQTDFPTSVNNVFQNPPKAAMVIEGDFVPGVATVKAKPEHGLRRVPVPVDQRLADPSVESAATRSSRSGTTRRSRRS